MENDTTFNIPILFITYNKLDTTLKVLDKIREINPSNLVVSSDGSKNSQDTKIINLLRNEIDEKLNDSKYKKIYNNENLGCKKAVTSAIEESFKEFSQLIILEDDTLPGKDFFTYAERMLQLYDSNKEISLISGYNYLIRTKSSNNFYFSKYSNIWGWATWKSQWENRVELNEKNLNKFMKLDLTNLFFSEFEKEYYITRFKDVVYNDLDSWAYGLSFSNLYQNKYSIIPKYNLVKNIGLGHEKATHTKASEKYLISTPNIRLGYFQKHNYTKIEPVQNIKNDYLYYKTIIEKTSFYNKLIFKLLKLFKKI